MFVRLLAAALPALCAYAAEVPARTLPAAVSPSVPPATEATQESSSPAGATAPPAIAAEVLARPVVIGASMSSGFGLPGEITFATVLGRALRPAVEVPTNASEMFFLQPLEYGSGQGDFAHDEEATIVLAVDYLFWFGYGTSNADGAPIASEEERLALLEVGLDNLSQLDCPLVVGDFPDMSDAVGKMLLEAQMPEQETLAKLTARVHAWAKERGRTVVVPLASLVRSLASDEAFQVGCFTLPAHSKRRLLQRDELHPTLTGLCLLAHIVTEELLEAGLVEPHQVRRDLRELLASFELPTEGIEALEQNEASEQSTESDG